MLLALLRRCLGNGLPLATRCSAPSAGCYEAHRAGRSPLTTKDHPVDARICRWLDVVTTARRLFVVLVSSTCTHGKEENRKVTPGDAALQPAALGPAAPVSGSPWKLSVRRMRLQRVWRLQFPLLRCCTGHVYRFYAPGLVGRSCSSTAPALLTDAAARLPDAATPTLSSAHFCGRRLTTCARMHDQHFTAHCYSRPGLRPVNLPSLGCCS